MCYTFTELILSICVFSILVTDEQPHLVKRYLTVWLVVNGIFFLLKFCYGYALVYRRSPGRTENYRVGLQFIQSVANSVLFIVSYTGFGGDAVVQKWFWLTNEEVGWFTAWTGFVLGLY